jgi:hypothetical protein
MLRPLTCAVLLQLGAVACGGELDVGTSYRPPLDAGADAADAANPDPLARAAGDMAGTWTTLFFDTRLTLTLMYTSDRGGTWTLQCGTPPQKCNDDVFPLLPADAGIPSDAGADSPFGEIRKFLSQPKGEYWVHKFSDSSNPSVEGILTSVVGVGFEADLTKQTLAVPGNFPFGDLVFTKVTGDAGTRP